MIYHFLMKGRKKVYKENGFAKFLRVILIIILLPVVIIYLFVRAIKNTREKRANKDKIKIYNLSQIDSFSGTEFESYLKILFEKMGYRVSLTKKSKDFGADLVLNKNKKTTIVQAKCHSKTVGVKAVQEIIGAKKHYGADEAVVVTNNYFSKEADILALENDIKLLDRTVLENLSSKFDVRFEREKPNFSALTKGAVFEIESKYKYWI